MRKEKDSTKINGYKLSRILGDNWRIKKHEDSGWAYYFVGEGSGQLWKISIDGTAIQKVIY